MASDPKADKAETGEPADAQPETKTKKARPSRARKAPAGSKTRASAAGKTPSEEAGAKTSSTGSRPAPAGETARRGRKAEIPPPAVERVRPRLEQKYLDEVAAVLIREFGYTNPMQAPRVDKVVLNIGLGEALTNSGAIDAAVKDLAAITGQRPVVTRARKSIANFKLRDGNRIGVMVTLRGDRMWDFLDRLLNVVLPRVRDFHGIPREAFDGRGNYTLGLAEQVVFPEIDYNRVDKLRGLQVTVVTTARTDEEARRLLELLGTPFAHAADFAATA